jgi:hypothetical protein
MKAVVSLDLGLQQRSSIIGDCSVMGQLLWRVASDKTYMPDS